METKTRQAMTKVRDKVKVKASDEEILRWIRSVGPDTILAATLKDIREIAAAF